jgi:hypothetical protein
VRKDEERAKKKPCEGLRRIGVILLFALKALLPVDNKVCEGCEGYGFSNYLGWPGLFCLLRHAFPFLFHIEEKDDPSHPSHPSNTNAEKGLSAKGKNFAPFAPSI